MPVEEIKLTARFKVDLTDVDEATISEIHRLFKEYRRIVNELIEYAHSHGATSPRRLWYAKYRELRQRYPTLPSHYIHTACQLTAGIYKSFIEMKKLGMCEKERPIFKGRTIWLDRQLFRLDVEGWRASIAVHGGRWVALRLLHGRYHEKFKNMRLGEARLVLKDDGNLYLNVAFHQAVMLPEISADAKVIAVDVNENAIVYGNDDFIERFETNEGIIRTRYFLKRRRIQSRIRGKWLRARLLEKYRSREWRRIKEIYHKAVKRIIDKAKEADVKIIIMEDLKHLNRKNTGSKELNGRLHRWSYSRFQKILEYQAKLCGLHVKYVNPRGTSKTCPICGDELEESSNGRRLMKCWKCGLEEDKDVIAVKNLVKRYYEECMDAKLPKTSFNGRRQIDVGSPRSPRKPPNEKREEGQKAQNAKLTFLPPLSPQYLKSFLRAC
ncbi:MAG: RNA-guided endonuclease TnpB family protein [Thaumarchaeota archaeon]|nr:RNA-guided endonuclease TnpB family protein [Candidatus Wolframiiraptor allenii]